MKWEGKIIRRFLSGKKLYGVRLKIEINILNRQAEEEK